MRAFIAIKLPADIKNAVSRMQDKLKLVLPKVSWVKPVNLHLSLKFLGEISPKQLDKINQITAETVETITAFRIKLESLGAFPNLASARIIWIGADQLPKALEQIVAQLETKLAGIGIAKEDRPFRAHITIGRIKGRLDPGDLEKGINQAKNDVVYENLEFNTPGITLFESTPGKDGPTYTVLKETNFKIT
ncbi:MAG: RNA 2',3'-cyclic phosphodiesterase [Candidatus Omnitrophica bacterium]|nr:RNA 2',3'-cyclic phosphodiesterase [Candidatus Omnitrophota bacterium]